MSIGEPNIIYIYIGIADNLWHLLQCPTSSDKPILYQFYSLFNLMDKCDQSLGLVGFFVNCLSFFLIYIWTVLATAFAYIYSLSQGSKSSVPFLKKNLPGRAPRFYFLVDFLGIVFVGSLIGIGLLDPNSPQEAVTTGLSWFSIASTVARGSEKLEDESK